MEGKFIVGDKEIIFNNDAKIFCEAWLTYCFGKELIKPEVNKIIHSNIEAKKKVFDIFNLIEGVFRDPEIKLNKANKGRKKKEVYEEIEYDANNYFCSKLSYSVFSDIKRLFNSYFFQCLNASELRYDLKKEYLKGIKKRSDIYDSKVEEKMTSYLLKDYFLKSDTEMDIFPKIEILIDNDDDKDAAIFNKLLESAMKLIDLYYRELFIKHINKLIYEEIIYEKNILGFNLKESNDALLNIKKAVNKKEAINDALIAFPGNVEIYSHMLKCEIDVSDVSVIIKFLSLDKYLEKQLNKIINLYKKKFKSSISFVYNKNIMDLLAFVKGIERKECYMIYYNKMHDEVIKKYSKFANVIKTKSIKCDGYYGLLKNEFYKNNEVSRKSVQDYYIGNNADLYILQDELGYQDLSKELSYLIGASDYLSIGEVFGKYIDEFHTLLSNQITVEVKKERRVNAVIKLIISFIGLTLIVYFLLNPDSFYAILFFAPAIVMAGMILKSIFL